MPDIIWIWWPGAIPDISATWVAAIIGAVALIAQSRHAERLRLKLKIYEQVCDTVLAINEACAKLVSKTYLVETELRNAQLQRNYVPATRWGEISDLQYQVHRAAIGIVELTERWRVLDRRMRVFQVAANVAATDLTQAFSSGLTRDLIATLPLEMPGGGAYPWSQPSKEVRARVLSGLEAVRDAAQNLTSYAADFQAEMQNLLVRHLGDGPVPERRPLDPDVKVVTLKHSEELLRFFESDQTAFGRSKIEAEERALAMIRTRTGKTAI